MEKIIYYFNLVFPGSPLSKIRAIMGLSLVAMLGFQYLKIRRARKRITVEEEQKMIDETYEKDENGLYPWETDTNDSPKRIPKDAMRVSNDWAPKRGRWN